jgi:hypothetical protein
MSCIAGAFCRCSLTSLLLRLRRYKDQTRAFVEACYQLLRGRRLLFLGVGAAFPSVLSNPSCVWLCVLVRELIQQYRCVSFAA